MPDNLPDRNNDSENKDNLNEENNSSQNSGGSKKPNDPSRKRTTIIIAAIFVIVALFAVSQIFSISANESVDNLDTGQFIEAIEQGRVESVVYAASDYTVTGTYYPASTAGNSIASAVNTAFDSMNLKLSQSRVSGGGRLPTINTMTPEVFNLGAPRSYSSVYVGADSLGELLAKYPNIQYRITLPNGFASVLISLIPFVLIAALLIFFFSQMQKANNSQLSFGKNKAKKTMEERPDVKFSDVAGVDEAVEEMQEVKDFLANPKKYQSIGAKIPRGCLLVGPPGTGKTLLARAVAGEAGVPFFSISGSDFVEMFVGVGASRVRDLFKDAKEAAPSIIFIDEIDAVGRQRGTGLGGGHDEREQTLNQLLVEMDGFEANESVVLIAATNRSDVLDPALLRPGRFDRQIVVDTPDVKGRERILQVHSADKPISSDVDLSAIAKITPGFTGADLANLMNEAALLTARKSKKIITMREVNESLERVIAGPERKGRVLNEHVKRTIAYHESGHALVGHLLNDADPVHKISIISRGRALGYTLSIPDDDKPLKTLSEMRDELAVFMGGRVAEEVFCDDITTGASNDLERASKMARAIVTQYGMSPLGTQVFGQPNHEVFLGRDYGNTQDYSDETARRIDEEVSKIMKEAHDRAYNILMSHTDQMNLMASVLLERETVEGEACQALLDNKWNEYLAREGEIIAAHEREEAEARARDLEENPNLTIEDVEGRPIERATGSQSEVAAPEASSGTSEGQLASGHNYGAPTQPPVLVDSQTEDQSNAVEAEPEHTETSVEDSATAETAGEAADDTANDNEIASTEVEATDSEEAVGKPGIISRKVFKTTSKIIPKHSLMHPADEKSSETALDQVAEPSQAEEDSQAGYAHQAETTLQIDEPTVISHQSLDDPFESSEDDPFNVSDLFTDSSTVTLLNPDWRDARVEPGDQDPNGPYWEPAENADKSDEPTQAEIDEHIAFEDEMLSSPEAPDPDKSDSPYADPYMTAPKDSEENASKDSSSPYDDPYNVNE